MCADSLVGTRLREYEITEEIGKGGMGTVYKARHIYLHKERAIKVIRSIFAEDARLTERFIREAKILSELDHPNLVRLYEFGRLDENTFFMVQEYVRGESIYHLMKRVGTIPLPDSIRMIRQAAIGLGSAHRKSIVHRDISPDNLMLTQNDSAEEIVKVIDFGIAKPLVEGTPQFTATRAFVGKAEYCSPEQTGMLENSSEIDHRTDIYSLAVTLYYMLIGKLPFHSPTPVGYLFKHAMEQPTPLLSHEFSGAIPVALDRLVLKALSKKPDERHSSMEDFVADLDQISTREPDEFGSLFESGKRHYDKKEWQEALAYWNRALQISPGDENLKQWIQSAENQRSTIIQDTHRASMPPLPFEPSVAETRPRKDLFHSRRLIVGGILIGFLLLAASIFIWKFASQRKQFELIDASTTSLGTGSADSPTRMKLNKTYKVSLRRDEQYYFKTDMKAGRYRIIEDTSRTDGQHSNLYSSLSVLYPGRDAAEDVISFNEIDTDFRRTHRFFLRTPTELKFTISNHQADADFFLTIQNESDTRFVPLFGEIIPTPLKLEEKATGFLERYDSAFYKIPLPEGKYQAEWAFTNSENQKTNIQGYLALLESDGGNQRTLYQMNEIDVTSKKSVPIILRRKTTVILRLENHHTVVDYVLQVKRTQ
jgi:serine/threonine protein kinase